MMERPFLSSILMVLGFFGNISPLLGQSLSDNESNLSPPSSKKNFPPPPPNLPPPPPPPPPPLSPPSPPSSSTQPPPPPSNFPPPPPHSPPHHHHHSPPPLRPHPKNSTENSSHSNHNPKAAHQNNMREDRKPDRKINLGKKIGLLFAAIAGLLQVAVVGFLVFKRWQISKIKDRDVNYAS